MIKDYILFLTLVFHLTETEGELNVVWVDTVDAGVVDTVNIPLTSYWNNPTLLSDYGYNSRTENALVFMVKACADSFVAMKTSTASAVSDDTYELVIGSYGGSRVVMRLNGDNEINLVKSELLSCFSFRSFWLHWTNGSCSLGKGLDIGVDELIKWTWSVNTTVKDIGIMTGFGATGQWIFFYGYNKTDVRAGPLTCSSQQSNAELTTPSTDRTDASSYNGNNVRTYHKIDKTSLSSYIRSKSSAPDSRISAVLMGAVGVTVLVCVVIAIVVMDIISIKIGPTVRKHK
ncbi:uncharacterized protein LOC134697239 [Mytilus trossulus]|uniref:uncharacterized protein LOC134697239 n=1 Tax=Mytilus trossulus TaxID=6551 RepID=UPI003007EE91